MQQALHAGSDKTFCCFLMCATGRNGACPHLAPPVMLSVLMLDHCHTVQIYSYLIK